MTGAGLKLGLLGGTFNPIHLGHLRAAEEIAESLALDKIMFIPAAHPPHKDPSPVISFAHRLAMTRLAVAGRPGFLVSDIEGRRKEPSYTVETLRLLHQESGPDLDLYFITGLDAFLEIHTWKEYRQLFDLTNFVAISRPGSDSGLLTPFLRDKVSQKYVWEGGLEAFIHPEKKHVYFRTVSRLDISSTDIRSRLARKMSIRYLVMEQVRRYIIDNGLYQLDQGEKGRV